MPASSPSRHELGQWFTPPELADLVIALTTESRAGLDIVDPTCGDGVFLARALAAGCGRARGLDLDANAVAAARHRAPTAHVVHDSLFAIDPDEWLADAVVGNPPYVRQERLGAADKQRARACLAGDWPAPVAAALDPGRRADLAVLCLARMLRMTRPGGRVGLVVSSALFDAGYARALWLGLQRVGAVVAVVESPCERWFVDAAVNAAIIVVERGASPRPFPVARLSVPVARAGRRVRGVADLDSVAEVRMARPDRPESWARLMRASAVWLELERTMPLVRLGEVAELRRGVTSGANDVFYLDRKEAARLAIEDEVLVPLVRSPREPGAETIDIDPQATPSVALVVPPVADPERHFPAAWAYLRARSESAERPTLRARSPWWSLPRTTARLFLTKAYAARFVQRIAPSPVMADQRVYAISPKPGVDTEVLAAILNSTFTALALESLGRASLGQGALEWTVADARSLPIVDPRTAGPRAAALRAGLGAMARRPILDVGAEAENRDRRELDGAVAATAGLEPAILGSLHEALCSSVARRQRKASSVERSR